jgi:hypothetical protein
MVALRPCPIAMMPRAFRSVRAQSSVFAYLGGGGSAAPPAAVALAAAAEAGLIIIACICDLTKSWGCRISSSRVAQKNVL